MNQILKKMKEVPGYPGYFVSKSGIIISFRKFKNGNLHKPQLSDDGYLKCALRTGDTRINSSVHRIVAMTYVDNPNNLPEVNHIDGDKFNNYYTNLEWSTHLENMQHAKLTGLTTIKYGKDSPRSRLILNTETGIYYDTSVDACNSTTHLQPPFFCMMLKGKRKNNTSFIYA